MKFLIDAQLPLRLSDLLAEANHDSIHTSSLPDGNRTGDRQLADIADSENRVVVTKDRDFRDSHPYRNMTAKQSMTPRACRTDSRRPQKTIYDIQPTYRVLTPDRAHTAGVCATSGKVETAGIEPASAIAYEWLLRA